MRSALRVGALRITCGTTAYNGRSRRRRRVSSTISPPAVSDPAKASNTPTEAPVLAVLTTFPMRPNELGCIGTVSDAMINR